MHACMHVCMSACLHIYRVHASGNTLITYHTHTHTLGIYKIPSNIRDAVRQIRTFTWPSSTQLVFGFWSGTCIAVKVFQWVATALSQQASVSACCLSGTDSTDFMVLRPRVPSDSFPRSSPLQNVCASTKAGTWSKVDEQGSGVKQPWKGHKVGELLIWLFWSKGVRLLWQAGPFPHTHWVHHTWFSFVNTSTIRVKGHQRCHGLFSDASATCHWLKNGMQEDKA